MSNTKNAVSRATHKTNVQLGIDRPLHPFVWLANPPQQLNSIILKKRHLICLILPILGSLTYSPDDLIRNTKSVMVTRHIYDWKHVCEMATANIKQDPYHHIGSQTYSY